tara:strand:- start:954 stop:1112 length:159 start_codon:yes stop_codon:yes gene_type:complete
MDQQEANMFNYQHRGCVRAEPRCFFKAGDALAYGRRTNVFEETAFLPGSGHD